MKLLKPVARCSTAVVLAWTCWCGFACGGSESRVQIRGKVVDVTPDLSRAATALAKLDTADAANLESEFGRVLDGMYGTNRSATSALVTAKGDAISKETVTDTLGEFSFVGLPSGDYELTVGVVSGTGTGQLATVQPRRVYRISSNATAAVTLPARRDFVAIRGRITDAQGQPIPGAKVRGEPYPVPESADATPPTRHAVSGVDGSYELSGFVPDSIYRIAGFLAGGDPTEFGQHSFYAEVHVEAEGHVQEKTNVPRVALVTEELLAPARHLLRSLNRLRTSSGERELVEKKELRLPPSQGSTIGPVDIKLKRTIP